MKLAKRLVSLVLVLLVVSGTAQSQTTKPAKQPTYRGKKVTDAWIDAIFKELRSQYYMIDGVMTDAWAEQQTMASADPPTIQTDPPPIGALRMTYRTVLGNIYAPRLTQILEDGSIICDREFARAGPMFQDMMTFRIAGLDSKTMAEGQKIDSCFVYTGTYKYGSRTIQSYAVPQLPTREEFVSALTYGTILVRHHRSSLDGKVYDTNVP